MLSFVPIGITEMDKTKFNGLRMIEMSAQKAGNKRSYIKVKKTGKSEIK